jgi:hypothetical protein
MLNDLSSFSSAIMSSRMDAEWSYDQRSGRYRDEKGRFLSKASVGKLVDGRIDKLETQLKRFTRMLGDGSITLDQWQGSVREAIKAAFIFKRRPLVTADVVKWEARNMVVSAKGFAQNTLIYKVLYVTFWMAVFLPLWLLLVLASMLRACGALIGKARKCANSNVGFR